MVIIAAMFGTTELIIVLVLFIALFGLGKLPKAAKQLGLGVRNFKDSMEGKDIEDAETARIEDQSAAKTTSDAALPTAQETGEPAPR